MPISIKRLPLHLSLAALALAACGGDAVTPGVEVLVYGPRDGKLFPTATPIGVGGQSLLLSADEVSLVTWPEYEDIPLPPVIIELAPECETRVHSQCSSEAFIDWTSVATERWYAVRFRASTSRAFEIDRFGGILLSDGSRIWRVYRGSAPQVDRILFDEADSAVRVVLSEEVGLVPGASLADQFSVTQAGSSCVPNLPGERFTLFGAACDSSFDYRAPTTIHIGDGWITDVGTVLPPLDRVIDFDEAEDTALFFEPLLPPPPVPTALCAGTHCEE